MKIHLPANAIIMPIIRNGVTYYFFLDTGFPYSFANELDQISSINHHDVGCEKAFTLSLNPSPIDTQPLSEHLMVDLAGFLGMDFLQQFDNVVVNFANREIGFNVTDFQVEASVPLKHNTPLTIDLAVGDSGQFKTCLVDTGCYQSLFFDEQNDNHPKSLGWQLPSAFGPMEVDFYAGLAAKTKSVDFGKHVFGKPKNLPKIGFDYVLGLNILSQYECCFNLNQNSLQLRKNPRSFRHGADLHNDLYALGIQLIRHNGALLVDNVLTGFDDIAVKKGDHVFLPDLDLDNPEIVNRIYARLLSFGEEKQVPVLVNGVLASLKCKRIFE
jgi:hypothetical protein